MPPEMRYEPRWGVMLKRDAMGRNAYASRNYSRKPPKAHTHNAVASHKFLLLRLYVTKRRSRRACIGNPKPEQETIKGTHAQETSAYQRRPTTQHAAQGCNPPIRALYMQLAKIPHTHQTTPRATSAASADQHGTRRGRNRYHPSAHMTKDEAPGQLPGAQRHV